MTLNIMGSGYMVYSSGRRRYSHSRGDILVVVRKGHKIVMLPLREAKGIIASYIKHSLRIHVSLVSDIA